jgi:hypothetical protein
MATEMTYKCDGCGAELVEKPGAVQMHRASREPAMTTIEITVTDKPGYILNHERKVWELCAKCAGEIVEAIRAIGAPGQED